MSTWIRIGDTFNDPVGLFRLPRRVMLEEAARYGQGDPRPLVEWFEKEIARMRPGLAGGVVIGMKFNLPMQCVEVMYCHRDLPSMRPGSWPKEYWLDPDQGDGPIDEVRSVDVEVIR